MQTSNAIQPSTPPSQVGAQTVPADLPPGARRTIENNRMLEAARLQQLKHSDSSKPGPPNSYFLDKVLRWIAPKAEVPQRVMTHDGLHTVNRSQENVPRAQLQISDVPAGGELIEFVKKLQELREQAATIHAESQVHYNTKAEYAALVRETRALEDREATAGLDGIAARRKLINESRRAMEDFEDDAVFAEQEFAKAEAALKPIQAAIVNMELQLPQMQRAALVEMLSFEADALKAAHDRVYHATIITFGICRALTRLATTAPGDHFGAGLESHLCLPSPEHPDYQYVSVPNLHRDVQGQADWLLDQLSK